MSTASRALYAAKFERADALLGDLPGYAPPQAGFFLWLADGRRRGDRPDALARGRRARPARRLSRSRRPARATPARAYIRVALVAGLDDVSRGLGAIRATLDASNSTERV